MHYFSKVTHFKEDKGATDLIVRVEDRLGLKIQRLQEAGPVHAEIRLEDGRVIRPDQRKKIFATINDIAAKTGDHPEDIRAFLLYDYCASTGEMPFSLSDCSVTQARNYLSHIIDFVLEHNIPLSDLALHRTEDIDRYLYKCLAERICVITGRSGADIHHVTGSRVGMGRNRIKISHSNLELIALSREWHNKVHDQGEIDIFKHYKIYGIKVDNITLKYLGIKHDEID